MLMLLNECVTLMLFFSYLLYVIYLVVLFFPFFVLFFSKK